MIEHIQELITILEIQQVLSNHENFIITSQLHFLRLVRDLYHQINAANFEINNNYHDKKHFT